MNGLFAAISGALALALAVGWMAHIRGLSVSEQYALGRLVRQEAAVTGESVRLRERWERASDPARLRARAEAQLDLQSPRSRQVLR